MTENCKILPEGYKETEKINLQNDKKCALFVNLLSFVVAAVMIIVPLVCYGIKYGLENTINWIADIGWYKWLIICAGIILYMLLHEIVHGIVMKYYSGVKPKYGFTGLYAFAGSSAYFNRKSYIVIALAPIVVWGIVLAVLQIFLPDGWGIIAYSIQIINVSGAAGDLYVSLKFRKLPKDILINDTGIEMTVYSKG
ncbi:MAG: DUF3267 domain-containing protein [Porcipelethomonas sp.]